MGDSNDLSWSVKNGDVAKVKEFIEQKKEAADSMCNGRPLLCIAADYGQTEVIDYLLRQGADINKSDNHGLTPLLSAIYESHVASVRLLLDKGAKTGGKAPDGSSYIECAEKEEIKKMLQN